MNRISVSSLTKKFWMALTGVALVGFIVGHLVGNLQIFLGPEVFNAYAAFLQSIPGPLWGARLFLLAMLVIHIVLAALLVVENRKARPVGYAYSATIQASYASRTMKYSGPIVFFFIVYHLLHFTFRLTHPELAHLTDAAGRHDVYTMVVKSFQNPVISIFYIVAVFCLCLHLSHGLHSWLQSFGLRHPRYTPWVERAGALLAWVIFAGYAAIPLAALLGFLCVAGSEGAMCHV